MSPRRRPHSEFSKTTRRSPCPVCHQAGCLLTGPTSQPVAVVCRRTKSPKPVGNLGFLHVIDVHGPVYQFTSWGRELAKMVQNGAFRTALNVATEAVQNGTIKTALNVATKVSGTALNEAVTSALNVARTREATG